MLKFEMEFHNQDRNELHENYNKMQNDANYAQILSLNRCEVWKPPQTFTSLNIDMNIWLQSFTS